MDNLTHSLAGILLARAGLGRLAPHGTALAVAAANLPDLDIVSGAGGSLCYLAHHRGFTHAFFWMPLVALAPLPLWWLWSRRQRHIGAKDWAMAYVISLAAVLSHLLLDALNVYGIRLLHPFSSRWLHADLVNIVDVWIWAVLLVCVLGPMLARLVYSEIGARGGSGRGMAWLGLLLLCGYVGLRAYLHQQATGALITRLYGGETPLRVLALPSAANPWSWTGLVETRAAWRVVPVDLLLREFDPEAGRTYYKPAAGSVRQPVLATETARVFLDFSQCPLWRITPAPQPDGAVLVRISDLRFGLPDDGAFTAEFLVDASGRVLRQQFAFGTMRARRP